LSIAETFEYSFVIEPITHEDKKIALSPSRLGVKYVWHIFIVLCGLVLFLAISGLINSVFIGLVSAFILLALLVYYLDYLIYRKPILKSNFKIIENGIITKQETVSDNDGGFYVRYYIGEQFFNILPYTMYPQKIEIKVGDKISVTHVLDKFNQKSFFIKLDKIPLS
jgi:hypothetical protein